MGEFDTDHITRISPHFTTDLPHGHALMARLAERLRQGAFLCERIRPHSRGDLRPRLCEAFLWCRRFFRKALMRPKAM